MCFLKKQSVKHSRFKNFDIRSFLLNYRYEQRKNQQH